MAVSYGVISKGKKKKRQRDLAQLAKEIVDEATDQLPPESTEESEKNPKAKAGRKGGLKGGKIRAKKLTAEQRRQIAKKAALARWKKSSD